MVREVVFGKAGWGYFVDVRGDDQSDFCNVGIYEYKRVAQKIAREKAKELNVLLRTDWGNETQPPSCLDSILQIMGSKNPLRSKPIVTMVDGEKHKDWLTKSGWIAYGKLTTLLYGIGTVCEINVENIVEALDALADSDAY